MHHIHTIAVKTDVSRVGENVVKEIHVLQVFCGFLAPHLLAFSRYVSLHQLINDAPCLNYDQTLPRCLVHHFHRLPQRIKDGRVEIATKLAKMKMSGTANPWVRVDDVTQQSRT